MYKLQFFTFITSNSTSRAFSVSAPSTWNSLPAHIRSLDKLLIFKRQLKSHLSCPVLLSSHPAPAPQICLIHDFGAYNFYVCMFVYASEWGLEYFWGPQPVCIRKPFALLCHFDISVKHFTTKFKCSVDQAKRSFYRAANSIFARVLRVGRLASEEVLVQLLKHKCLSILLYALEVCNLD